MITASQPAGRTVRIAALLMCVLVPPAIGLLALALGQDANWDLRNYHWYNPYALLTGRWEFDVGAGAYYNPWIDVPMYLAAQHLSAKSLSFALGTVQGLNFVLLFALGCAVLRPYPEPWRTVASLAAAFVGVTGGGFVALVGTTFNDTIVSLLILGATAIVAARADDLRTAPLRRALIVVAVAGLVMGAGVGLKLPMAIFAAGFCAALLVTRTDLRRRLALAFVNGVAVLAGIGLSAGGWMWRMWVDYRNPLFPYFNAQFGSPMGLAASYRDVRFLPKDVLEALAFPLVMTADPAHVGEIAFRDIRIAIAFLLLLAVPLVLVIRRRRGVPVAETAAVRYLAVGMTVAFVAWEGLFAIYRYAIPLEMTAPLLAVALIAVWPASARTRVSIAAIVLLVALVTTVPGSWGRRASWTEALVEVTLPPIPDPDRTLVVFVGIEPLSYVIPALPVQIPVLRLQGYLTDPKDTHTGLNQLLRRRIAAHTGDIYLLVATWERQTAVDALRQFGLAADFDRCGDVASNLKPTADIGETIAFCPVVKAGTL